MMKQQFVIDFDSFYDINLTQTPPSDSVFIPSKTFRRAFLKKFATKNPICV